MSIIRRFMAQINNEKVNWYQDEGELFKKHLRSLDGKWIWLTVERFSKQRSLNQNRYYWGVVINILKDEIGYTKNEMHDALRRHFLTVEEEGKILPTVKSTTELDTMGFEEYLQEVREWADTEMDIVIPLPNEVDIR